jgi:hypothetical protein
MYGTYQRLNLHVYATDREVIRAVRKKFKRAMLHNHEVRKARHDVYRKMLEYHHEARALVREWRL